VPPTSNPQQAPVAASPANAPQSLATQGPANAKAGRRRGRQSHKPPRSQHSRQHRLEEFEQRLVFSADTLALADATLTQQLELEPFEQVQTYLAQAHQQTGLNYVVNEYELAGAGQTVAVIDSGIAWDHQALGQGFGAHHQVVGGWDFAEGDANPYDDGPAGFHGTHVSGIVGSRDSTHRGVASGVDLVALRVFDDQGAGYLGWVEQALQWVHENRNEFDNPITTVNLSLGVDWNADNVPNWANLEDEFQLLVNDGIFISVAAGNAFQQYNSPGVSYPAASPWVVPVASHDADGEISDFSQRNDRVLVAPGRSIQSTVPDHLLGTDDHNAFVGASGTSMAAPYVAGASTLVRQAFEFMGFENIDQTLIYNHFRQTADQIFDAATQTSYSRINLSHAIDALITDVHGDTQSDAYNLGSLGNDARHFDGIIGGNQDVDWFRFHATTSGTATLEFDSPDQIPLELNTDGTPFEVVGNKLRFHVSSGQSYQFSIASDAALGKYNFQAYIDESLTAQDLGNIAAVELDGLHVHGEKWFRFEPHQSGIVTAQAVFGPDQAPAHVEIYNEQLNRLTAGNTSATQSRASINAQANQSYLIKVSGVDSEFQLRLTNLVSKVNGRVNVVGSAGSDLVDVDVAQGIRVTVNGVRYNFDSAQYDSVRLTGFDEADSIAIRSGVSHDHLYAKGDLVRLNTDAATVRATLSASIHIDLGTGQDIAVMQGDAGLDRFDLSSDFARLTNRFGQVTAEGFDKVVARASNSVDRLTLGGSLQDDFLVRRAQSVVQVNTEAVLVGKSFASVLADTTDSGGFDRAILFDSSGDDSLVVRPGRATLATPQGNIQVRGFQNVATRFSQGTDDAQFFGSASNDSFYLNENLARFTRDSEAVRVFGAETMSVDGRGGQDRAFVIGSRFSDTLSVAAAAVSYQNTLQQADFIGFEKIDFDGHSAESMFGVIDAIQLHGVTENDQVFGQANQLQAVLGDLTFRGDNFSWLDAYAEQGTTARHELQAVDFWFDLHGNWDDV